MHIADNAVEDSNNEYANIWNKAGIDVAKKYGKDLPVFMFTDKLNDIDPSFSARPDKLKPWPFFISTWTNVNIDL